MQQTRACVCAPSACAAAAAQGSDLGRAWLLKAVKTRRSPADRLAKGDRAWIVLAGQVVWETRDTAASCDRRCSTVLIRRGQRSWERTVALPLPRPTCFTRNGRQVCCVVLCLFAVPTGSRFCNHFKLMSFFPTSLQEQLRRRREDEERIAAQNDFLRNSLRVECILMGVCVCVCVRVYQVGPRVSHVTDAYKIRASAPETCAVQSIPLEMSPTLLRTVRNRLKSDITKLNKKLPSLPIVYIGAIERFECFRCFNCAWLCCCCRCIFT